MVQHHHHQTKPKDLGIKIINGDQSSNLPTMLGIKHRRQIILEEAVNCEIVLHPSPSYLGVLDSIQQVVENTNELIYCSYYLGTKNFKPSLRSLDTILPDD